MNIVARGNILQVKFPYNPAHVERIKTVPGRKWDGAAKAWTVPIVQYEKLLELFPWAVSDESVTGVQAARQERVELSTQTSADFDVPGLLGQPFPYQRAGVKFLEMANGRAIVGDEMGLGKTLQSLAYLQLHPELRPALVVCPASLKLNWEREVGKWMSSANRTAILSGTRPKALPDADILICNYDILYAWQPLLSAAGLKAIICDEAHNLKEASARRTKAAKLLIKQSPHTMLLTGTPVLNRPKELWPLLNMVAPDAWPDFFGFARRYCNARQEEIRVRGGGTRLVWNFDGASNLAELHGAVQPFMVRRLKADVLKELPAKRRVVVPLEMSDADKRQYSSVLAETQDAIRADESNALAQLEALKQAAVTAKLPGAIEWIREFVESEKLIVFAIHKFVVDALIEAFPGAVKVDGSTSQNARQAAVDKFQTDDNCRLFVGNIQAAGVGLTLTAASNVAFLEYPWTPALIMQAEDRAHRIGQTNSVTAWNLLADGTIDNDIFDTLESKRVVVDIVTDGTADNDLVFDRDVLAEVTKKTMERKAK